MKKVLCFVSMILVIAVMLGTIASSAASGPNTGWIDRYTPSITESTGHVQCQANYSDAGRHAQQGRVRVIIEDEEYNVSYTGYSYTTEATNQYDTTVYTASKVATVPAGWHSNAQYAFKWYNINGWTLNYEATE